MLKNIGIFKDKEDGTIKYVFKTKESNIIEISLLFNKKDIDVICVPTHHFCNLGCKMCHLTNNNLNKKMKKIELNDFLEAILKTLVLLKDDMLIKRTNKNKLLISFMGVGDPLLNLELIKSVYLNEQLIKDTLNYSDINYAISTMMPNDNIKILIEMVNELSIPLKLHFSLHTPVNEKRKKLIPSTNVTIEEALQYMLDYRNLIMENNTIMNSYIKFHRTTDPVEIHYTLIEKINDSNEELKILCDLLQKYKIPIKFIKFNPVNELKISEKEKIWVDTIKNTIKDLRIKTYTPPGRQIGSSCGEFTKHYYHEEIETIEEKNEFNNWKNNYQVEFDLTNYLNNNDIKN